MPPRPSTTEGRDEVAAKGIAPRDEARGATKVRGAAGGVGWDAPREGRDRARLAAVLAHVPGPAFILGEEGGIVMANQRGWEHLSTKPDAFEALRRAKRDRAGAATAAASAGTTLTGKRMTLSPIAHPEGPEVLAIVADEGDGLPARLAACTRVWSLTKRQAETLALAARGESNKEIAAKLGCTEATVEIHMTRIFEKSGARNRATVIAAVWCATA